MPDTGPGNARIITKIAYLDHTPHGAIPSGRVALESLQHTRARTAISMSVVVL